MALEMKYFVLKPRSKEIGDIHAKASRLALEEYARIIRDEDPSLADSIREWVLDETVRAMRMHS